MSHFSPATLQTVVEQFPFKRTIRMEPASNKDSGYLSSLFDSVRDAIMDASVAQTGDITSFNSLIHFARKSHDETYEINGGEMYAKQLFGSLVIPNYWNLYDVLANLLSDGRLGNYGGILLAEYYRGYDSLALSGAGAGGAYVVSD